MNLIIILSIAACILVYLAYYFSNTISSPTLWPELEQISISGNVATLNLKLSNDSQAAVHYPRIEILGSRLSLKTANNFNNINKIRANETIAFELALTAEQAEIELARTASRAKLLVRFTTVEGEERFTQFNLKSGRFRETRRKP